MELPSFFHSPCRVKPCSFNLTPLASAVLPETTSVGLGPQTTGTARNNRDAAKTFLDTSYDLPIRRYGCDWGPCGYDHHLLSERNFL